MPDVWIEIMAWNFFKWGENAAPEVGTQQTANVSLSDLVECIASKLCDPNEYLSFCENFLNISGRLPISDSCDPCPPPLVCPSLACPPPLACPSLVYPTPDPCPTFDFFPSDPCPGSLDETDGFCEANFSLKNYINMGLLLLLWTGITGLRLYSIRRIEKREKILSLENDEKESTIEEQNEEIDRLTQTIEALSLENDDQKETIEKQSREIVILRKLAENVQRKEAFENTVTHITNLDPDKFKSEEMRAVLARK